MKFKFYFNLQVSNNIYKYYMIINETNLENAKIKFFNYINKNYCKPSRIELVKIEKIIGNNIYDLKVGDNDVQSKNSN